MSLYTSVLQERLDPAVLSRLLKLLLLRAAFNLLMAPSKFCIDVAYDILRQVGAPKASPGTMATCAFSSKNLHQGAVSNHAAILRSCSRTCPWSTEV